MRTAPIGRMNDWHWKEGRGDTLTWIDPDCLKCSHLIKKATKYFKCSTDECPAKYLNAAKKRWLNDNTNLFDLKGNLITMPNKRK